jgi:membrane-associated phospholipid phosphatase
MRLTRSFLSELTYFWHSTIENWLEWAATVILAACSGVVALLIRPDERLALFQNFTERFPFGGETLGIPLVAALIIILPCVSIGLAALLLPRRIDLSLAGLGFSQTLCLTLLVTEFLKVTVARPRPNFFSYCGYDVELNKCVGPAAHVRDARLSFPSGHASNAFAAGTWMAMFIGALQRGPELWWVLARLTPIFIAIFIAATRITDYMHHVSDVIGGAVLGMGVAVVVFNGQYNRVFMINRKKTEEDDLDPFAPMDDEL